MDKSRRGGAPRPRRTERRGGDPLTEAPAPGGGRAGFSLVEVMVAILLTAIIVTSVFAVAVTAQKSSGVFDRKVITNYAASQLLDRLRNYVTASTSGAGTDRGPNGTGAQSWTLPGDSCTGCGGSPNCYALDADEACLHDVTTMLPQTLRDPPYNMTMTYQVTDYPDNCAPKDCKYEVDVNITWGELQ